MAAEEIKPDLIEALLEGSIEKAKKIVLNFELQQSTSCSTSFNSLCSAIKNSYNEAAILLIQNDAQVNNTAFINSPLHYAVSSGNTPIAEMLLEKQANVNAQNENGNTPLHVAAAKPREKRRNIKSGVPAECDLTNLLLKKGANVNATNNEGETPLHSACKNRFWVVARMLIEQGAEVNCQTYRSANSKTALFTPLHFACLNRNLSVTRMLVKGGANLNAKTVDGYTPLYYVVKTWPGGTVPKPKSVKKKPACDHHKLLLFLLQNNADPTQNPELLNIAIHIGYHAAIEPLLLHGAEVNPPNIVQPLHMIVTIPQHAQRICSDLLERGAIVDSRQTFEIDEIIKQTESWSIDRKHWDLIAYGGRTALHLATKNRLRFVVLELLDNGADVNCRDANGSTPLSIAFKNKDGETVRRLLDYGGDINDVSSKRVQKSFCKNKERCSHWCQRISETHIFSRHIIMLIAAGFYVKPSLIYLATLSGKLSKFQTECEKEIAALKTKKISAHFTLYDVLRRNLKSVTASLKYCNITEIKSLLFDCKISIYDDMILRKLTMAEKRLQLLAEMPLESFVSNVLLLPHICVENIVDFLSNEDLRILILACKPSAKIERFHFEKDDFWFSGRV